MSQPHDEKSRTYRQKVRKHAGNQRKTLEESKKPRIRLLSLPSFVMRTISLLLFKGRVHIFFIRELDVPPLGESNLMGPKKSDEVKFFTVAFFGGCRASSMMTPGTI